LDGDTYVLRDFAQGQVGAFADAARRARRRKAPDLGKRKGCFKRGHLYLQMYVGPDVSGPWLLRLRGAELRAIRRSPEGLLLLLRT
jgi:hypothetical protein